MNSNILKHIIRYILMLLIIVVCCMIFSFSNDVGEKSSKKSSSISYFIVSIKYKNLTELQTKYKANYVEQIIRKVAHFSIYALLGILIISCLVTFKGRLINKFNIAVILSFIYACSDEFHQKFVPGRSRRN